MMAILHKFFTCDIRCVESSKFETKSISLLIWPYMYIMIHCNLIDTGEKFLLLLVNYCRQITLYVIYYSTLTYIDHSTTINNQSIEKNKLAQIALIARSYYEYKLC